MSPRIYPRYMMATRAESGGRDPFDISRDEPDLAYIEREDGNVYRGEWATGFGFVNVAFPKDTTRDLTPEEIAHYQRKRLSMPGSGKVFPALDPTVAVGESR